VRQPSGSAGKSKRAAAAEAAFAAGLYLVATPIGHASDITLRALAVLQAADVIACEDTRVTARLLAIHGIARPLARYDEHTAQAAGPALVRRIASGQIVALVTDAGTPLVSDPGGRLVRACIAEGVAVVPVPGPSAPLAALSVAGLPAERFLFAGFLPPKTAARRRQLALLAAVPATLVFLESPKRLAAALADMAAELGPRPAAVARELTKLHEEVRRGALPELAAGYAAAGAPRGEVTVVVGPPSDAPPPPPDEGEIEGLLIAALACGSPRRAAEQVAAATGLPRRPLYNRAIRLRAAAADEPG
jgi:16S rRNA (cytidine1402-2'-O)-methyltransferase